MRHASLFVYLRFNEFCHSEEPKRHQESTHRMYHTQGKDIHFCNRRASLNIDSQPIETNAQIHTISGYSAHADQSDLLKFDRDPNTTKSGAFDACAYFGDCDRSFPPCVSIVVALEFNSVWR